MLAGRRQIELPVEGLIKGLAPKLGKTLAASSTNPTGEAGRRGTCCTATAHNGLYVEQVVASRRDGILGGRGFRALPARHARCRWHHAHTRLRGTFCVHLRSNTRSSPSSAVS